MFPTKPALLITLLCALVANVSGCGQTGPLVLPEDSENGAQGTTSQTNE